MDEMEKIQAARDTRDRMHENELFSEKRSAELADEFTRLEVQIAAILFGFVGLFVSSLDSRISSFPVYEILMIKIVLCIVIFSLITSLVLGLIHIRRKEIFWDELMIKRIARFHRWNEAARREISFENALAFHEGTALETGNVIKSPMWTWILQTISLGIAVALIFTISMILLLK